jgi:hypothetical protein
MKPRNTTVRFQTKTIYPSQYPMREAVKSRAKWMTVSGRPCCAKQIRLIANIKVCSKWLRIALFDAVRKSFVRPFVGSPVPVRIRVRPTEKIISAMTPAGSPRAVSASSYPCLSNHAVGTTPPAFIQKIRPPTDVKSQNGIIRTNAKVGSSKSPGITIK